VIRRSAAYIIAAGVAVLGAATASVWLRQPSALRLDDELAMVQRYCIDCHNAAELAGGVSFEGLRPEAALADAELWEKMLRKLRADAMPPHDGGPRPTEEQVAGLVEAVETALDRAFAARPQIATPVIQRLNRTEYTNAVRDLLAVEIDAAGHLPPDNVVEGFDNIGEALTVSPALLTGYLSASAEVASFAVGDPERRGATVTYRTKPDQSQHRHVPGAPLGTLGGLVVEHNFPVDGRYRFEPRLYRQILASVRGLEFANRLVVTIDKERVHSAAFGGRDDQKRSNEDNAYAVADEIDARLAFEHYVTAGPHVVAATFMRKPPAQSADVWKEYQRQLIDSNEDKGLPHLDQLDVRGPLAVTGIGDTPSRRRILTCTPASPADERYCATEILSNVARRAYRRPVREDEIAELLRFFDAGRTAGSFDRGIELGLRRILSGAEFVFRSEITPAGLAPGAIYRITDLELASRLSFFLWSSVPDDELLDVAGRSELSEPAVLRRQVTRMLADPKADALVENFAGQWLALRNLEGVVPDPAAFPDFDNNLRIGLVRETQLLFAAIVREDRSILDVLDADYTFVNERLARHYGIAGVYGERFRRVAITDPRRRGILGHGSFLTMTSVATRTSPVTRGKWILDNLLGLPPGDPPPNVPSIDNGAAADLKTLRARMTRHRQDAACASCHSIMDPFGFALENFDGVGRWREADGGIAIDAKDVFFDGSTVDGVEGLRAFLLARHDLFVRTFTEKLATYALGRSVSPGDMPALREVVRAATAADYRFSTIVSSLVESAPFQMRSAPAASQPLDDDITGHADHGDVQEVARADQ
jgi:mono/diheme cytochrome c family protein